MNAAGRWCLTLESRRGFLPASLVSTGRLGRVHRTCDAVFVAGASRGGDVVVAARADRLPVAIAARRYEPHWRVRHEDSARVVKVS
jgi:hypothetical protein